MCQPSFGEWAINISGSGGESNRTCINFVNNTTATGFGDDGYFLEQYTGNTFQLQRADVVAAVAEDHGEDLGVGE